MKKPDLTNKKVIILVEGQTEQVLLPCLASAYGLDLSTGGAMIIPAGGAKQLARKYLYWKKQTNLPIFCLLDRDAQEWADAIACQLREEDYLHILAEGEIEDLMQLEFFVSQLNSYLNSDCLNDHNELIAVSDFTAIQKRTVVLDQIWRQRQLGKFEKVKFAQFIGNALCSRDKISTDGKHMLDKLSMALDLVSSL